MYLFRYIRFPGDSVVKNLPATAGGTGDVGSVPGSGRFPGGENGYSLLYACWKNSRDREAWWAIVRGHKDRWGNNRNSDRLYFFLAPKSP